MSRTISAGYVYRQYSTEGVYLADYKSSREAYEATGDYNYASNVYNSYLEKNEGNAEIYNQLGLCEMAKGEYRKALDAFQAGMQLQNVTMMQTLSFNEIVAYEHLGDYRQASILMENYLKNYPDDAQAKREYEFLSTR